MKLCVIPARGGSKRIPRKNIREFCGKPMIRWAIDSAFASGLFEKVIVSTDDDEIAQLARSANAEVPFLRPRELADDLTPIAPVMAHAIQACQEMNWPINFACCIFPCVPFLQINDLISSFSLMQEKDAPFSYVVTEYAHPTQRAMYRSLTGKMVFVDPSHELTRTQDFEKTYHDAGQFYWGTDDAWKNDKMMHTSGVSYVIPGWRVVDIDNDDDWRRAELMYKAMHF